MGKAPAFQLYAADFDMDTNTWDNEEVGIYFRLLMSEWVNGPLPNDEIKLARIVRIGAKKFSKRFPNIRHKFQQNGDGNLINVRLEEVREKQDKYKESQKESGKRGAEKRWDKDRVAYNEPIGDPNGNPNGETIALHLQSSYKDKEEEKQTSFIFLEIPLKDNTQFELIEEKVKEYEITYSNIDVRQELKNLRQWNIDNKDRRKTRGRFLGHVNTWLQKANQSKGYIQGAQEPKEIDSDHQDNRTEEEKRQGVEKWNKFCNTVKGSLKTMD